MLPRLIRVFAACLDALIALLAALVVTIAVTGGRVISVQGHRVSMTGVDNPLLALGLLFLFRYAACRRVPFLLLDRWTPLSLGGVAHAAMAQLPVSLGSMTRARGATLVCRALVLALIVKALLAYTNPGFFSGDDVEVQEMSLRAIWHAQWPIWDLRSAFFPLGFVYPFQIGAASAGINSVGMLVFAGRLSVVLLSSATIWLVWRIARDEWSGSVGWAVVAASAFALAKLHISFGSSELPPPVSAVFAVAAFALLHRPSRSRECLAAVSLGIAACFRFSEAVFLLAAACQLLVQRRWASVFIVLGVATATAATILGLTDFWYWGAPFHSVRAAVDYTLIDKLSSRGYQGFGWYVTHAPDWVNPAVLLLALFATAMSRRVTDIWAWLPIVVLSALPHKEARYLIPALPFIYLVATRGLHDVAVRVERTSVPHWLPLGVAFLMVIGIVHDLGHWRLPRSNADIQFVIRANEIMPPGVPVLAEQAWRLGGHLYLREHHLVDLDPGLVTADGYLSGQLRPDAWVILDSRSLGNPMAVGVLRKAHYEEVPLTIGGSRYRLWRTTVP